MKKIIPALFTIIFIGALLVGAAYVIDQTRMEAGESVIFSTWGKNYSPIEDKTTGEVPVNTNDNNMSQQSEIIEKEVTLYFPDENIMDLHGEKRLLKSDNIPKSVVEAVISGPKSEDLIPALTSDVKVISASVSDGTKTCVVDLSKEFALNNTGGSAIETFAIYSIVNSLCQLPEISNVKINIEGNNNAAFGGHYDISVPIEPDMTIVK